MTCLFDLDCFNTRRFKPYTGKTLDCANYLSESDREGGRMLSSASKLPHLLAHFRRPFWAWSTPCVRSDPTVTQLCLHLLGLQIFPESDQEKQRSATRDVSESSKLSERFPHMAGEASWTLTKPESFQIIW